MVGRRQLGKLAKGFAPHAAEKRVPVFIRLQMDEEEKTRAQRLCFRAWMISFADEARDAGGLAQEQKSHSAVRRRT